MARCRCLTGSCICSVEAGPGIAITGAGSVEDPWVISGISSASGLLQVQDTATLDLILSGTGTAADPFVLSGNVNVASGGIVLGHGITGTGTAADPVRIDICTYGDLAAACAP